MALVVSACGLGIPPIADDWPVLREIEEWRQEGRIIEESFRPQGAHWSPLWFLSNATAYVLSPSDYGDLPLMLLRFPFLALTAVALLTVLRSAGVGGLALVSAVALWALHQGSVGGVFQWKALGSVAAHALGATAAARLLAAGDRGTGRWRDGWYAAILLFAALLFKETALSWGVFAGVIGVVEVFRSGEPRRFRIFVPVLIACLAFVAFRHLVGTPWSLRSAGGATALRYHVAGPIDWARNATLLAGAAATPVSTVRWIDSYRHDSWSQLGGWIAITLSFNAFVLAGAIRAARENRFKQRLLTLASIGLVTGVFPVALMAHVSEAYLAPLIFWYAVVFGVAVSALPSRLTVPGWISKAVLLGGILLHVVWFVEKRNMMAESGRREATAAVKAGEELSRLPSGSRVCMTAPNLESSYSFFRIFRPQTAVSFESVRRNLTVKFVRKQCDYTFMFAPDGDRSTLNIRRNDGGRAGVSHRMQ